MSTTWVEPGLQARDAYPCCRHCDEDREHDVPPEGHAVPCDDCEDES